MVRHTRRGTWARLLLLLGALGGAAWAEKDKEKDKDKEPARGAKPPAGKVYTQTADAAAKAPCPEGSRRVDHVLPDANGKPWDRELACEDKRGLRQGLYERYWLDEHGAKSAEGHFKDGKLTGPWVTYWDNGFKAEEGQYEDGKRVGHWNIWHSNGRKAAEGQYLGDQRDGRWTSYNTEGEVLHHGEYVKGKRRFGEDVVERGEAVDEPGGMEEEEEEREVSPTELRERRAREQREREMHGEGPAPLPRGPWDKDRKGPAKPAESRERREREEREGHEGRESKERREREEHERERR